MSLRLHPLSTRLKAAAGAGLAVIVILLTFTGWELSTEFSRSRALRAQVASSYETRLHIQDILTLLVDAETSTRGYVLTGEPVYLDPYRDAVAGLPAETDRLRAGLGGRAAETAELDRLDALASDKLAILAQAISARDRAGVEAALKATPNNRGKLVMDEARKSIRRLLALEAANLEGYARDVELRTQRTETLIAALFLALVAVILAAVLLAIRYVVTRRAMLADIGSQVARQQAIFNSAIDAIVTVNPSGSIETVNAAAETMFGYTAAELDRRDISLLVDIAKDGDGEFLKRLGASQGALERGLIRQMDATRRTGDVFPVDVAVGAMHLPTGTHIVAVIRDVSERRRIEQLKAEFVSTVSHELRTPLTSIAGSLGLLAGGAMGAVPEKAGRLIQIAHVNSQRLVRLINDILDIEKIESGKLRLELAPLDLRDIAQRSIDGVRGFAEELGVSLSLEAGEPALICGDADRLIQVVTNLLSNASKFSPQGDVVSVSVHLQTRMARLSVADKGPGIPDAFRSQIFTKFAQADSSDTRAKGGTGLGLAIAREITERHGGRLWFESTPGEGSIFHLDLPLLGVAGTVLDPDDSRLLIVDDDLEAASMLETAHDQAIVQSLRVIDWMDKPLDQVRLRATVSAIFPRHSGPLPRVLHVDDDRDILEVTASALSGLADMSSAASLAAARAALSLQRPDLVILDLGLPDGSGLELLTDLRDEKGNRAPIIVYSAQAMDEALTNRVDAVLTKSKSSLTGLARTVRRLTGGTKPQTENA